MTKVKLNDTLFELSEDAALIIDDYLEKLKLYHSWWKISDSEYRSILDSIHNWLMDLLGKKSSIEKIDIDTIIDSVSSSSKIKKWRNFFELIIDFIVWCFSFFIKLFFTILRILFKFLIFFFFLLLFFGIMWGIIGLFFLVPFMFFDFVVDWWHIMNVIPDILKISLVWIEIFLVLFALMTIGVLLRKKIVWRGYWILGVIILILSINWLIYSWIFFRMNYADQVSRLETYSFELSWKNEIKLSWFDSFDKSLLNYWVHVDHDFSRINIEEYTWKNLEIKVKSIINDHDEKSWKNYFEQLWPTNIVFSWDVLEMKNYNNIWSKQYKFLRKNIEIKKPIGVELEWE